MDDTEKLEKDLQNTKDGFQLTVAGLSGTLTAFAFNYFPLLKLDPAKIDAGKEALTASLYDAGAFPVGFAIAYAFVKTFGKDRLEQTGKNPNVVKKSVMAGFAAVALWAGVTATNNYEYHKDVATFAVVPSAPAPGK